jgi:hypothetical protein
MRKKKAEPAKPEKNVTSWEGKAIQADEEKTILDRFGWGNGLCVISVSEFKGKKALDVRLYYGAEDTWRPTGKGLRINRENFETLMTKLAEVQADEQVMASLD